MTTEELMKVWKTIKSRIQGVNPKLIWSKGNPYLEFDNPLDKSTKALLWLGYKCKIMLGTEKQQRNDAVALAYKLGLPLREIPEELYTLISDFFFEGHYAVPIKV